MVSSHLQKQVQIKYSVKVIPVPTLDFIAPITEKMLKNMQILTGLSLIEIEWTKFELLENWADNDLYTT